MLESNKKICYNKCDMEQKQRYNQLNAYLKKKFGSRTLKISIDGGFTCPNRDGTKGTNGCLFCSASGSGDHLFKNLSIKEQILSHLNGYRGKRADKFIVYFQNFSNTYAPLCELKTKYTTALSVSPQIVGLAVATRPDCINENICKLLSQIKTSHYVWVELGLQTINSRSMKKLNLCYTQKDFITAVNLLHKYDIEVVVHIMIGLPNETEKDVLNTVNFINNLPICGVKFHSTYVEDNTGLATLYKQGKYTPLELDEYIRILADAITHLKQDVIIHRITGDGHLPSLLAPKWNSHKKLVLNGLSKYLKENNLYQGIYHK